MTNEFNQVHFRIEFSADRNVMDGCELSWDEFVAWLQSEYNEGSGRPGAVALVADFVEEPVKVTLRYRTEVASWESVP